MTKRQYFGTDGIRAPVGSKLMTPAFLLQLGWAIGMVLQQNTNEKPSVMIGRDTRLSGQMLESALMSGLLSAGCDVTLLGVLPTPAIAYLTKKQSASAGIVISASHNVFEDNGVKCIGSDGMKFSDAWELAVESFLTKEIAIVSQNKIGSVQHLSGAAEQYIAHCLDLFPLDIPLKIVLDCANGAAVDVALPVFSGINAEVAVIHNAPDGTNINQACGATNLKSLQNTVVSEQADCGLAFDGDADRLIMVDHLGAIVDGDQMLGILAAHTDYKGIVGTLMTNLGLEKALAERDVSFSRADVGDRYVLAELIEKGWRLGGEASGHVINLDYAQTGDGIITGLQILKVMQDTKLPLAQLATVVKKRPQILINVPVANPKIFSKIDAIKDAVSETEKLLGSSGRVLLRASGTESCVRVMIEADDQVLALKYTKELAEIVKEAFSLNAQTAF